MEKTPNSPNKFYQNQNYSTKNYENNQPVRPAGAYEDDFDNLNDWTITDIATTLKANPEDRQNASAEIAKRQKNGTYNPDSAIKETSNDLLLNGYGIAGDKILYPIPEYKSWLKSDRTKPKPSGLIRESLEDRISKNPELLAEYKKRSLKLGESALKSIDIDQAQFYQNHKKPQASQEFMKIKNPKTFEQKQRDKNNPNYTHKKQMHEEESIKHQRVSYKPLYDLLKSKNAESRYETKILTPEQNLERAYNKANFRLNKHVKDYFIEGAVESLSSGKLEINPRSFITDGFIKTEKTDIEHGLYASNQEKFWDQFKYDFVNNKLKDWNTIENIKDAEKDAISEAIIRGGFVEKSSLEIPAKFQPYLPIFSQSENAITNFAKEYDINLNSKDIQELSYQGFINIIETIKNDKNLTRQGFKALDWYFKNFKYAAHFEEVKDYLYDYQEYADSAFRNTLNNYLDRRQEVKDYEEAIQNNLNEDLTSLANSKKIEDFDSFKEHLLEISTKQGESIFDKTSENLQKDTDSNTKSTHSKERNWPSQIEKCSKALSEIDKILTLDPEAIFEETAILRKDSHNKNQSNQHPYVVAIFKNNDFLNVIAMPIGKQSDALFCWREKTDDVDAWRSYFKDTSIRGRDKKAIKRFVCKGYKKEGFISIEKMWNRLWDYLNSPDREDSKISA